ncbi:cytochrome c [Humisphaera borealis]|uniref:Cytochrome c n=1 Tax=Humisphaera borealis TaxID=2807512 RepID=A0A7M2WWQ4_9BACT|nr:cytochrome c [Humisphaera borealis]QOV89261.1 cytochrome c [Humisphaera borealis]
MKSFGNIGRRPASFWRVAVAAVASLGIGACGGPTPPSGPAQAPAQNVASSPATNPVEAHTATADTKPSVAAGKPAGFTGAAGVPTLADNRPLDYPGLHNVVAYAPNVYSGSVPEGDEGFATLQKMGIKTIVSVDGSEPELDKATQYGLKYIHLPITYAGFDEKRKLELARAVRDLPKPLYMHCHHGKHRSAGALGSAVVTLGWMSPVDAVERMKVSGTAPDYKGLYACTANATKVMPAILDAIDGNFPEVVRPQGTTRTMVEIDVATENLKLIQKSGWKVPNDHPALAPAAEAGKLADYYRFLIGDKDTTARPPAYLQLMQEANKDATALEEMLTQGPGVAPADLDKQFKVVTQTCKSCHAKFRD